MPTTV